jgi:hypothetical protein
MATNNTFTQRNKLDIAFKKLVGKAHTNPANEFFNEGLATSVQLGSDTIFGESIPSVTTPVAFTDGGGNFIVNTANYTITNNAAGNPVAELVPFELVPFSTYDADLQAGSVSNTTIDDSTADPNDGSNDAQEHAFKLKFRSDYETDSNNPRKGGTFGRGSNSRIVVDSTGSIQFIPEIFGAGFAPIVRASDGTQISSLGNENWIFDPFNGILFVQDQGSGFKTPASVTASIYVGKFATETVTSASVQGAIPNLAQVLAAGESASLNGIELTGSADLVPLFVTGGLVDFSDTALVTTNILSASKFRVDADATIKDNLFVTNDINVGNDVIITGDLVVRGTTTAVNTDELNIEDPFILLGSSSAATNAFDGGIIVQRKNESNVPKGTALYFDQSREVWSIAGASGSADGESSYMLEFNEGNNANPTDQVNLVTVQINDNGQPFDQAVNGRPLIGADDSAGDGKFALGQMWIDTTDSADGGLYIYLPE